MSRARPAGTLKELAPAGRWLRHVLPPRCLAPVAPVQHAGSLPPERTCATPRAITPARSQPGRSSTPSTRTRVRPRPLPSSSPRRCSAMRGNGTRPKTSASCAARPRRAVRHRHLRHADATQRLEVWSQGVAKPTLSEEVGGCRGGWTAHNRVRPSFPIVSRLTIMRQTGSAALRRPRQSSQRPPGGARVDANSTEDQETR